MAINLSLARQRGERWTASLNLSPKATLSIKLESPPEPAVSPVAVFLDLQCQSRLLKITPLARYVPYKKSMRLRVEC